ncbi:9283_t:CDS:1, partial [Diversispora eburnea]
LNGIYGSSPAATVAVLIHEKRWYNKEYSFLENILQVSGTIFGCVFTLSNLGTF